MDVQGKRSLDVVEAADGSAPSSARDIPDDPQGFRQLGRCWRRYKPVAPAHRVQATPLVPPWSGLARGWGGADRRPETLLGVARARYRGNPGLARTIYYWAAIANNLLAIAARVV
jgi:hypothetical protein